MSTAQIANMVARAITRAVEDSSGRQTVQVEATKDELIDNVPRFQNYGMTSKPAAKGTDCLVLFPNGDREQGVIVAMENRQFRLVGLKDGEVAMYDDLGNVFKFAREQIELTAVQKLVVTTPEIQATATVSAMVEAPIVVASGSTRATLSSGPSSIDVTPTAVNITSAVLTHNGKNIGATHYHVGSPATAVPV